MPNSECWSYVTIFFHKYCEDNKFEELEVDTDSLYLASAKGNLEDCILPEKKAHWQ